MAAEKAPAKAGAVKKRKTVKKAAFYKISGDKVERTRNSCPKCGQGVFMAAHKNRETCGKCSFTQWKS